MADFLQLRAVDVSIEALGEAVIACAAGEWVQFGVNLPADAEFVQLMPMVDEGRVRLFFFHESFPVSPTAESVPVETAEIRAAERKE